MKKTNSQHQSVKNVSRLAMFLSLAILLNYLENFIPVIIPIPGVKLGLANTMNLIVLYFFGRKNYFMIGFLRVLLICLMFNGLFTNSFYLSMSGFLLSSIMVLILNLIPSLSIFSLSVVSAMFHGIGQIICSVFLFAIPGMGPNVYFFSYLPILVVSGIITGIAIAFISKFTINRLERLSFFRDLAIPNLEDK